MKAIWILCMLIFLAPAAYAQDSWMEIPIPEMEGLESGLGPEEREISGNLTLDGSYDSQGALGRLAEKLMTAGKERLRAELGQGTKILVIVILWSLGENLCQQKGTKSILQMAGCACLALVLVGDLNGVFRESQTALQQTADYSKAAIPAIYTAAAAAGALVSAPVKYAAASFCMDALMSLSETLIIPMIRAYTALGIGFALTDSRLLSALSKIFRWACNLLLTISTMAFTAYLSLSGVIAGSTDAIAVKTTKTVLSASLPIVGGILSDSAGVVLSAAALIRNSAGVYALIAVCAFCLGPFVLLLVKLLLFQAASAATEQILGGRASQLLGQMGNAMGMLLGLLGSTELMLFISITAGIRTVTA